jgi:hypothetical protein
MNEQVRNPAVASPGIMLLSAAIFGYFGFFITWNHYSIITGKFLLFVALLDWTLKGASIGFAIAAGITVVKPFLGNVLYCVVSLLSAVLFVVVAALDFIDPQHTAMHPALLLIFAAWNGYGAWSGLQELQALRAAIGPTESFPQP